MFLQLISNNPDQKIRCSWVSINLQIWGIDAVGGGVTMIRTVVHSESTHPKMIIGWSRSNCHQIVKISPYTKVAVALKVTLIRRQLPRYTFHVQSSDNTVSTTWAVKSNAHKSCQIDTSLTYRSLTILLQRPQELSNRTDTRAQIDTNITYRALAVKSNAHKSSQIDITITYRALTILLERPQELSNRTYTRAVKLTQLWHTELWQ